MSRWLLSFLGIDPHVPPSEWEMGLDEGYFRYLQHKGHEKAIARLLLVEQVLNGGTVRIYRGWCRPDKEDCFVYVGYPNVDYKSRTITTPAPPNMAFLVFVLPDGTISDWTWRPLESEGQHTPQGLTGELIWERSTT
jgi:hypothetical protein